MSDHDKITMLESERDEMRLKITMLEGVIKGAESLFQIVKYLPVEIFKDPVFVLEYGEFKHPGEEWKRENVQHHLDHATAHIKKYWYGMHLDPETGRSQLAHAFVRIGMAMARGAHHG